MVPVTIAGGKVRNHSMENVSLEMSCQDATAGPLKMDRCILVYDCIDILLQRRG